MDSTEHALGAFMQREQAREHDRSLPRVLLKIEDGHLVAREEPAHFLDRLFFDYSQYRLQSVVTFLMHQNFAGCKNKAVVLDALGCLDSKVKRHNNFFNWILGRTIEIHIKMTQLVLKTFNLSNKKTSGKSSATSTGLGGGVTNNNLTACYVNSTLQALRVCPSFRQELQEQRLRANDQQDALYQQLEAIYQTIEADRLVSAQQIIDFRAIASAGWADTKDPLTRQQDAALFCRHFLNKLGFKLFQYTTTVAYELPIKVPSLERQKGQETVISLGMSQAPEGASIADLCLANPVQEDVDKQAIANAEGFSPTECEFNEIAKMPQKQSIPTLQTITFTEGAQPAFLPLSLKRYDDYGNKISKLINPSSTIRFPLKNQPDKLAQYRLASVVVHQGGSIESGHYYSYVPHEAGGWVEYNDKTVSYHTPSDSSPVRDIGANG